MAPSWLPGPRPTARNFAQCDNQRQASRRALCCATGPTTIPWPAGAGIATASVGSTDIVSTNSPPIASAILANYPCSSPSPMATATTACTPWPSCTRPVKAAACPCASPPWMRPMMPGALSHRHAALAYGPGHPPQPASQRAISSTRAPCAWKTASRSAWLTAL